MKRLDTAVGVILAVLAGLVFFVVVPAGIPDRVVGGMSVAFYPKLLLALIIGFCVLLVAKNLLDHKPAEPSEASKGLHFDAALLAALPLCYLVIRYLGIPAFALLMTPPTMLVMGERRLGRIAITAICLAVVARVVVVNLLQRPPLGIW